MVTAVLLLIGIPPAPRLTGASQLLRKPHRVVAIDHGPDVTTAVIEVNGGRALMIDGVCGQRPIRRRHQLHGRDGPDSDAPPREPARRPGDLLRHRSNRPTPCEDENATSVTAVDVNPAVFRFAKEFPSNRNVLAIPRSKRSTTWTAWAWLRRTDRRYDVITLEPMPPMFTGTNALYSVEFYRLIASRLRPRRDRRAVVPDAPAQPGKCPLCRGGFHRSVPQCHPLDRPFELGSERGTPQQGVLLGLLGDRGLEAMALGLASRLSGNPSAGGINLPGFDHAVARRVGGLLQGSPAVSDDNLILTTGLKRHLTRDRGTTPARQTMDLIRMARKRTNGGRTCLVRPKHDRSPLGTGRNAGPTYANTTDDLRLSPEQGFSNT